MKLLLTTAIKISFACHVILIFIIFVLAFGVMQNSHPDWRKGFLYGFPPNKFHTEKGRQIKKWLNVALLIFAFNLFITGILALVVSFL